MRQHVIRDLRVFLDILRKEGDLLEIETPVDPYLEIAEIHRRVIAQSGPALLFRNVKDSAFPVVTNLFGANRRLEAAFGSRPQNFVTEMVKILENGLPPLRKILPDLPPLASQGLKIGKKISGKGPILDRVSKPPRLNDLPLLTSWKSDGGPFVTLPLIYTEHPDGKGHNLGMYRIQRYDNATTGIHWQIQKGGGFHYHEAEKRDESLPVTLFIGGPPALIMAAIAPLPENVPELMLASLLLGRKLPMVRDPAGGHDLVAHCEFAAKGWVPPRIRKPEGPFGDHYGYNSLAHDYPVFEIDRLYHRRNAIYPATVVGRPKQEDFYIGDFLQDLLSPLFPLVMSGVRQLKTFGEAGFHCLAAAKVADRYPREAFASGLRILGEGQLSLTKFLLVTDGDLDVSNFRKLWTHLMERVDWQQDLYIFANVSQDTLDYTGPSVNSGSKALLMGLGREVRNQLPHSFSGSLPQGCRSPHAFLPGTLVVEGTSYDLDRELPGRMANSGDFEDWQVVFLVDSTEDATSSLQEFIWTIFTRFEPAADICSARQTNSRFHIGLIPPVVIDCRLKPWYPEVLEVDPETRKLVDGKIDSILPQKFR